MLSDVRAFFRGWALVVGFRGNQKKKNQSPHCGKHTNDATTQHFPKEETAKCDVQDPIGAAQQATRRSSRSVIWSLFETPAGVLGIAPTKAQYVSCFGHVPRWVFGLPTSVD